MSPRQLIEAEITRIDGYLRDTDPLHLPPTQYDNGFIACRDGLRAARKAFVTLLETPAPNPAGGWKLVPETPTEEMIDGGSRALDAAPFGDEVALAYAAMLKAAPEPQDRTA